MENNRVLNNKASSVSASKKKSKNKHRYDYLWIASLIYLILGFFNIMFAWLGLACFFIPLAISAIAGNKAYCGKYCGRGQLFSLIGGRFGLSRKKDVPSFLRSKYFRYGFLIFFLAMFFVMIFNTYLVFSGAGSLSEKVTLLWTFKLPWGTGHTAAALFRGLLNSLLVFTALC